MSMDDQPKKIPGMKLVAVIDDTGSKHRAMIAELVNHPRASVVVVHPEHPPLFLKDGKPC